MPETVEEIIPDADVIRVHGRANFGSMSPREVIAEGVLKYAYGYSTGYTQLSILLEHGLIKKPKPGSYQSSLTKRGRAYLRAAWPFQQVSRTSSAIACARAQALEEAAKICDRQDYRPDHRTQNVRTAYNIGFFDAQKSDARAIRALSATPDTTAAVIEAAKAFLESGLFYDREYLSQDLNNRLDALRAAIAAHKARNG